MADLATVDSDVLQHAIVKLGDRIILMPCALLSGHGRHRPARKREQMDGAAQHRSIKHLRLRFGTVRNAWHELPVPLSSTTNATRNLSWVKNAFCPLVDQRE